MQGCDGTGPRGEGPMTGGGFGACAPGGIGYGRSFGRGFVPGRGRGYGPGLDAIMGRIKELESSTSEPES